MVASTLTSKGQTTIPIEIRTHLNLRPGDKLEFILREDGGVSLIPATVDIRDLPNILPKPKKAATLEDMENAIRERGSRKA